MPPMPKPSAGAAAANKGANTFGSLVNGMGAVAGASGSATSAVAALGGQIGQVASMFGPWGMAIGKVIETVAKLPSVFKAAADGVANYVQAFSPATAGRYQRAWADLTASIGQMLMPVLNAATAVVRWFGDTIAGLTPIVQPLINGALSLLGPYFKEIGNVVREFISNGVIMFQAWAPLIDAFGLIRINLQIVTAGMKALAEMMKTVNRGLAGILGVKIPGFDGSSVGKAFVNVQQQSVSSMLDDIRKRAYGLGGGGKENLPQQQVDILGKLLEQLKPEKFATAFGKVMQGVMVNIPTLLAEALKEILGELFKNLPKGMADAVSKAITDALNNWVPKFPGVPAPPGGWNFPGVPKF